MIVTNNSEISSNVTINSVTNNLNVSSSVNGSVTSNDRVLPIITSMLLLTMKRINLSEHKLISNLKSNVSNIDNNESIQQ